MADTPLQFRINGVSGGGSDAKIFENTDFGNVQKGFAQLSSL